MGCPVELKQKNALVCGSSDGIGKASAIELAMAGADVTLIARNETKLKTVLAQLDTSADQQHQYLLADFADPTALQQIVAERIVSEGTFHILVNNSGGPPAGKIFDADLDAFDAALGQHLKCNHLLVQTVVPGMKLAGRHLVALSGRSCSGFRWVGSTPGPLPCCRV